MDTLMEQVVAALFTTAITGLIGWVYHINSRVTTLEAERVNLENLEKLFTTKYEALEKLISAKFEHMQDLLQHNTQPTSRRPSNIPYDGRD